MLLAVVPAMSPLVVEMSGPVALTLVLEALQCFDKSNCASFQAGVDMSVLIMCCKKFDKKVISSFAPEVWAAIEAHVAKLSQNSDASEPRRLGLNKYALVQLCSALTLIGDPVVDVGLKAIHLPRILASLVLQFPRYSGCCCCWFLFKKLFFIIEQQ
jgi:hypothetical protein